MSVEHISSRGRYPKLELRLTAACVQSICPQLPVVHVKTPSDGDVQFVRPHIRPYQSDPTSSDRLAPAASSKPPVSGPVPAVVKMPGHIVSPQLLVINRGTVSCHKTILAVITLGGCL